MENYLKNPIRKLFSNGASRRFLFIFLLISMAAFLVLPKISLAEDFENITLQEIEKYLSIPANAVENLIHSLIKLFNSEWINQMASGYSTEEERAVPNIMREVVRVQALNHLLVDAPVNITFGIVKNGVKIAKTFLTQDPSALLEELERESVQRAVGYGMSFLLQNEIRVAPGAISFKYELKKGGIKETIFQYIMIYKPFDAKRGKLIIRFYSLNYLDIPKNEGSYGGTSGRYTELTHPLPPFIVDIQGTAKDYKWVGKPSMKIEFPQSVPDLGIKPLSFWERHVLKPIKNTIKDIEVIITKVTGASPNIVEKLFKIPETVINIWNKIKSTFSKINPFSPAALVQAPAVDKEKPPAEVRKEVGQEVSTGEKVETLKTKLQTEPEAESRTLSDLEKMQEELDDIAERIDIMSQEVAKLLKEKSIKEEEKIEEEEKDEEIEELEEKEDTERKEGDICIVNINTSSKEELQKIIGIGSVIAQRIIKARPFYSLNDLLEVKGIGPATLQKIIAQGCAYVDESYSQFAGSGGGTAAGVPPPAATSYPEILISEIQIEGANTNHDFIELYNPNDSNADISGYKLRKRTSTGGEYSINVLSSGSIIAGKGYYLWASSKDEDYPLSINSDTYTKQTLAATSSIALLTPDDAIISALAWGSSTNPFVEGSPFHESPGKNKSLGRIWDADAGEYKNSGDNSLDFEIQTPTPKTQNQSPVESGEEAPLAVVINEVAWMGTAASSTHQWIELYNNTASTIDITGWRLFSVSGNLDITFSTSSIPASGYYLIERTDDNAVSDIVADWVESFDYGLSNDGERLELRNASSTLIDLVDCSSDWFAGKASPDYISMERINPKLAGDNAVSWDSNNQITKNGLDKDGNPINGTPKAQNSVYQSLPPNPVINLVVDDSSSSANKAALNWLAPSDDDSPTANLSYDIRYLIGTEITEDNWSQALPFSNEPTVLAAGSSQTYEAWPLNYGKTYYFALKTYDGEVYSSLSNVVSFQTGSAPDFSWPQIQQNAKRTGRSSFAGPSLETATIKWIFEKQVYTLAIGAEGILYVGTAEGLYSLNPEDGTERWLSTALTDTTGITIGQDGTIYTISDQGLAAIDQIGNKFWEYPLAVHYRDLQPVVSQGKIYVLASCSFPAGSIDFSLLSFTEGGTVEWIYNSTTETLYQNPSFSCGSPASESEGQYTSSPAVDIDGNIYFGVDENIFAINSDGTLKWKKTADWYESGKITTSVIGANGLIYVMGGRLQSLNPETGETIWPQSSVKGSGYFSLALGDSLISTPYIPNGGSIYAVNLSGELTWEEEHLDFVSSSAPLVDKDNNIYIVTHTSNYSTLRVFNSAGEQATYPALLGTPSLGSRFLALSANGVLYIPGQKLYAIQ